MRKLALCLALVIIFVIPMEANATVWTIKNDVTLDFKGTAAVCAANIRGAQGTDEITVTMTLKLGENHIKTWTKSGSGYVYMKEETYVGVGSTYTLTVDVTINGVQQEPIRISKACWP